MNNNTNTEFTEMKKMLGNLMTMISMIIPTKVSVSYLSETTSKSRQSIRQYLINNFEPEVDFWLEGGKTFVAKNAAISIIERANTKKMLAA